MTTTPQNFARTRAALRFTQVPIFGNVYFVRSTTGSATGGYTADAPAATIAQALALCTASQGDTIFLAPDHAESIGASGLAWNVAGVNIIGLGSGSNRPTLTWHTTDAVVTVSAANVLVQNILTVVDIDEVVSMFLVTGAGVTFDGVDFAETTSAQAIQWMLTQATADDLTIKNCRHVQKTVAAATQSWIVLVGTDRLRVLDNTFHIKVKDVATAALLKQSTTACLDVLIARNNILFLGYVANLLSCFLSTNTTTGLVVDNRIGTDVAANTTINDMPGCYSANNLCTNAVDTSGIPDPVVDT